MQRERERYVYVYALVPNIVQHCVSPNKHHSLKKLAKFSIRIIFKPKLDISERLLLLLLTETGSCVNFQIDYG